MVLDLTGSCSKLARALIHLNELGNENAKWFEMSSRNVTLPDEKVYPHPDGYRHLFRIGTLTHPSPTVSLIVGDYVQNLRAALDHLAWEMVRRGEKPRPKNPNAVQFPIYSRMWAPRDVRDGKRTFRAQIGRNLPGIPNPQRAFVRSYQPYHRGKWHLAALADFSNQDKHRIITPVHLLSGKIERRWFRVRPGRVVAWKTLLPEGRRVNERTPYFEVVVSRADSQVEMYSSITTPVAFQERRGRYHRGRSLEEIGEKVAEIVGESARRWGTPDAAEFCAAWARYGRKALGLVP